ncbi:MAG: hypothetical protein ACWGQW_01120 [bacterium]
MPTQTYEHTRIGNMHVEFDVNTANWRICQVRCINNNDQPARFVVYELGVEIFNAIAPANQTTSWNTGGQQIAWDEIDGGIIWGDLVIETQYPA